MSDSFNATIRFALLTLAMIFTANLVGFVISSKAVYAMGTVLAIGSTAASYVAQSYFTQATSLFDAAGLPGQYYRGFALFLGLASAIAFSIGSV